MTIPQSLEPGVHHLVVRDASGGELARLEVEVAEASAGSLSGTGPAAVTAWVLAAATLLAAGGFVVARSRKRAVATH
ncbi:LPXTG cell wall anchor domain-containing protein [Demequina litorisediminis]|uniref:LPXTG-motif cell wall anchor domain-containing protein n=1 Tax=Demequina litorisediminis TaxID=1849022 RepID=A0ABQ6IB69_9MICO|nr:LPXTG cell wall anchor domain-containing protein [Demequina litorisediminis]GMA35035.1 hypothetical protein GCM10025876_12390 [Demequina litorisediminis]